MKRLALVLALAVSLAAAVHAAPAKPAAAQKKSKLESGTFSGLSFRSIGAAVTSGRIVDLAVSPADKRTWYIASAYGGVWKTTNAGTTFKPIFDTQGTASIGCVTIDPNDPLTVWVGSGENNSQRSVGWGDGVYRSQDGGKSWTNMGLKASEHVGMVTVDSRNSNVVYVAAQGPLWAPGGDRGVYKTSDGGKTWKQVLKVDDWTGAGEVHQDPHHPDVLYATTYQRHRKVWTLVDGGPGSGIWKSTDSGETWKKLSNGLPTEDMGRIGIVLPPLETGAIVANIEAANGAGGTYRSDDGGANWNKLNGQTSSSPQYYQELFSDPKIPGRLYMIDTFLQTSDDGGRAWRRAGESNKHVDNHIVWVDPDDSRHVLVGCDGGLYESFDRCATWNFFENLPITQYYKVDVDNAEPFYNVYGGTQDNSTWGGPSATNNVHGIRNSDWFTVTGGDGFQPRVDPTDPNIAYGQSQHGELVRFDRRTGNTVGIQPQPEPGEPGSHWNWDSPLIVSPHSHTRLYFASQRLYRTDDRGDSWTAVSPDLTRQIDRNRLKVMGRVWSVDAVAKNASTSLYGNIVAVDESPKQEGLLAVGTDDGLIQVSEDGGKAWRRIDAVPGVGEYAYVSRVVFSRHAARTLYATFDRHKMGDFKPYVMKSTDLGRSWTSITGDLPAGGSVYCFVEDTRDPDLLFAGTEFGLFFTQDGGHKWIALKGGLPIQCIRDVTIQRRDDDLVVATFGRGFYILDDLSPLRRMKESSLNAEATLLPPRKARMFVPAAPLGGSGKAFMGDRFFVAENPPVGATFTYYLADGYKSRKERRHEAEAEAAKKGGDTFYPSWDSLRAEAREEDPSIVITVSDAQGHVVRRLKGPVGAGFHRVTWDFRGPDPAPASLEAKEVGEFDDPNTSGGPLALPGTYTVAIAKRIEGVVTPLGAPQAFVCEPLLAPALPETDRAATVAFQQKVAELSRAMQGAAGVLGDARNRAKLLQVALDATPSAPPALADDARRLQVRFGDLATGMFGDRVVRGANEPTPPSFNDRLNRIVGDSWGYTGAPTRTDQRAYEIASGEFQAWLTQLKSAVGELTALEQKAEAAGAPWTPGRMPEPK